jgi:protein-S-isoprenylcysteine O-methyltransferase Ste14
MRQIMKWAEREYGFPSRIFATLLAGVLFVFLIPYALSKVGPIIDQWLVFPSIGLGLLSLLLGSILVIFGLGYALWSIVAQLLLARGTPLPMMATKKLLISGPFKQCRNPMSFGTLLLYIGISILVGSISAIGMVVVFLIMLIAYVKKIEERELEMRFGEEYLAYKKETPFIIPRIFPRKS